MQSSYKWIAMFDDDADEDDESVIPRKWIINGILVFIVCTVAYLLVRIALGIIGSLFPK